jgi:hypothetical protein
MLALNQLPRLAAIYFVVTGACEVLYIGKAKNLYQRWVNHHISKKVNPAEVSIAYLEVDESLIHTLEFEYIGHFHPPLNTRLRPPRHRAIRPRPDDFICKRQITVTQYVCERCGWEWLPREATKPRICPSCKSPYWDRPRRRPKAQKGKN